MLKSFLKTNGVEITKDELDLIEEMIIESICDEDEYGELCGGYSSGVLLAKTNYQEYNLTHISDITLTVISSSYDDSGEYRDELEAIYHIIHNKEIIGVLNVTSDYDKHNHWYEDFGYDISTENTAINNMKIEKLTIIQTLLAEYNNDFDTDLKIV